MPHIAHLYEPRTAYQFEKDIDFFLKYYEPVDLDFLKNNCHLKKPDKNYFHLTFDDGLREVYDIIAPILLRKGVPATIFLNVDFVDNQALFFRYKASLILDFFNKKEVSKGEYLEIENIAPKGLLHINFLNKNKLDEIAQILNIDFDDFLKEKQPYLETNKIQSLASQGFTFGGHSLNHPLFSEIPLSEKVRQATESTIFAKRITAQKTGAFAFPFTDFGVENTFFNKIFREKNIDISFGTAGLKQQRYAQHWQRFPMEEGEGTAEELVKTEYLYYMVKRLFGKHF
ncbi:MAG: peptidoglycan/xylan/chitin deacetylase (PgdA/CDA1 family) [Saprospiraceae bacterium]